MSTRLEPINYTKINDLHPGRYGDETAPWIQRKHFQAHNMSNVPLHGAPIDYYAKSDNRSNASKNLQQLTNPPMDPQYLPPQAGLRQKEEQLNRNWQVRDQHQEQANFKQGHKTTQDLGYLHYRQVQEEAMLQRFKEFQSTKQKEVSLESDMVRHLRDQDRFVGNPSSTTYGQPQHQNQYQSQQQPIQSHSQPHQNVQPIQQQQQNLQSQHTSPQVQKNEQNSDSLAQLLQKQQNQKHLNYRQRYQLNNNFYNPSFGISSEIFPEINRRELPYNHQSVTQLSYGKKNQQSYSSLRQKPVATQQNYHSQQELEFKQHHQLLDKISQQQQQQQQQPQQPQLQQPHPQEYSSQPLHSPPPQREQQQMAQAQEYNSATVQTDPLYVDTGLQALMPELGAGFTQSNQYRGERNSNEGQSMSKSNIGRGFRMNPTSMSFKGVPIRQYY